MPSPSRPSILPPSPFSLSRGPVALTPLPLSSADWPTALPVTHTHTPHTQRWVHLGKR
jgi:hypothetical protein